MKEKTRSIFSSILGSVRMRGNLRLDGKTKESFRVGIVFAPDNVSECKTIYTKLDFHIYSVIVMVFKTKMIVQVLTSKPNVNIP